VDDDWLSLGRERNDAWTHVQATRALGRSMSRLFAATRRAFNGARSLLATIVAGIWLIALYGVTVWLVVGSFTAIQIREQILAAEGDQTFADVGRAYERYLQREQAIYANWDTSAALVRTLGKLSLEIDERLGEIQDAILPNADLSPEDFWASEPFNALVSDCEANFPPPQAPCQLLSRYFELNEEYASIEEQVNAINYDQLWAQAAAQAAKLRASEEHSEHFDTYEFFAFTPLFYEQFVRVPTQVLTLVLTMVMGMLGSVITMTWSFIKRDADFSFRRFIILPFVGAMSAFIIFVFVRAGQLTLSSGGTSQQLNPFVLSFVGIISGLLSERAYARMAQVGSNFFRTDDDISRFGIALRTAVEQAGLSQEELARYLKLSDDDTASIIDGKAPADPLQQRLIAASLRRNIRELFTDLAPEVATPSPRDQRPPPGEGTVPPLQPTG